MKCLGFIKGIMPPYFYSGPDRVRVFDKPVNGPGFTTDYACDDGTALHFVGGKMNNVVREKQDAHALVEGRTKAGLKKETPGREKA